MIETGGASIPTIVGAGLLGRIAYLRVDPNGEAGGNTDVQVSSSGAPLISTAWLGLGVALARSGNNQQAQGAGHAVWLIRPTLVDGCAQRFRGGVNNNSLYYAAAFRDAFTASGAALAGTPGEPVGTSYASVMQAWLRKHTDGEPCTARLFFGWANDNALAHPTLAQTPRVGLHGDGANGFRFGSVHCPDGLNVGQTALNAIDAGAVQPAELSNPGAAWFHVRVKLAPATPTAPGAVGCYLNGVLVAVYRTVANMPRAHQAGVSHWGSIEPLVLAGFDGAQQLGGWKMRRFEVWYDLDLSL